MTNVENLEAQANAKKDSAVQALESIVERKANLPLAFVKGAAIGMGASIIIDKVMDVKFSWRQSIINGVIGGMLDGALDYYAAKRQNKEIAKMKSYIEKIVNEQKQKEATSDIKGSGLLR